jgi:hypothetical protein
VGDKNDGLLLSRQIRAISRFIRSHVSASSAPNGSSIGISLGFWISKRSLSRRRTPSGFRLGHWRRRSLHVAACRPRAHTGKPGNPTSASRSRARCLACARGMRRISAGNITLSIILRHLAVEALKHPSDVTPQCEAACWIASLDATVVRLAQVGNNFEQCRLAAARGRHDGDERTFGDVERDVGHCERIGSETPIGLANVAEPDQRFARDSDPVRSFQASQRSRLARTNASSLKSACAT